MRFIQQLHWRPEIGDPTVPGWLAVLACLVAALAAWLAARRAGRAPGTIGGSRGNWIFVALVLTVLGLHRQLDLPSLFHDIHRVLTAHHEWILEWQWLQKWLAPGAALAIACLAIRFREFWTRHWLLTPGLIFLVTLIAVRAVAPQHLMPLLKNRIKGLETGQWLEFAAIAVVGLAAYLDYLHPKRARKAPWKPAK